MASAVPFALLETLFRIDTSKPASRMQFAAIDLLDEQRGRAFLTEVERDLQAPTPEVAASLFLKRYLALIMGAFYSMSLHSYGLKLPLENVILTAEDSWKTIRFSLQEAMGEEAPLQDRDAWRGRTVLHISSENLQPVIAALSKHTRISPNVLWSHTAYLIHYYYPAWQKEAEQAELRQRIADDFHYLQRIEDTRLFGSSKKNPFATRFTKVAHPAKPGEIIRLRKHCCLAYHLPGRKCCYTCPKLTEAERTEQILAMEK